MTPNTVFMGARMIDVILSEVEARVLGALLEKEMATPEYYPLSLSALTNACNQKSNRDPVVVYDDTTVVRGLQELQDKKFVLQSLASRVPKYEQCFTGPRNLIKREAAVICILLLRGPQTVGEIRGRTDRLFPFVDLDEVQATLASLEDLGLVKKLPRQPGRKECRYAHLLCGEPAAEAGPMARPEPAFVAVQAENDRMAALQARMADLSRELADLQQQFRDFKAQFD